MRITPKEISEVKTLLTDEQFLLDDSFLNYLKRIACNITKRYDLDICLSNKVATNNKIIWINPKLPEELGIIGLTRKVLLMIGCLAHEIFHIEWSDFSLLHKLGNKRGIKEKTLHSILNIIEDAYVEAKGVQYYTGLFSVGIKFINEECYKKMTPVEKAPPETPLLSLFLQASLEYCILGIDNINIPNARLAGYFDVAKPLYSAAIRESNAEGRLLYAKKILVIIKELIKEEKDKFISQAFNYYQNPKDVQDAKAGMFQPPPTPPSSSSSASGAGAQSSNAKSGESEDETDDTQLETGEVDNIQQEDEELEQPSANIGTDGLEDEADDIESEEDDLKQGSNSSANAEQEADDTEQEDADVDLSNGNSSSSTKEADNIQQEDEELEQPNTNIGTDGLEDEADDVEQKDADLDMFNGNSSSSNKKADNIQSEDEELEQSDNNTDAETLEDESEDNDSNQYGDDSGDDEQENTDFEEEGEDLDQSTANDDSEGFKEEANNIQPEEKSNDNSMQNDIDETISFLDDQMEQVKTETAKNCCAQQKRQNEQDAWLSRANDLPYAPIHTGIEATTIFVNDQTYKGSERYMEELTSLQFLVNSTVRKFKEIIKYNEDVKLSGLCEGRLDKGRMYRSDGRHFYKRREKSEEADLAVLLALDLSGSMGGWRFVYAKKACMLLLEVCDALNLPLAIVGHQAKTYAEKVTHYHFKDFDFPVKHKNVFFCPEFYPEQNTREGMSLRYCGEFLLKRPENDKLLISISDGGTEHETSKLAMVYSGTRAKKDVRKEAAKLEQQGLHVVGVAIGAEAKLIAENYPVSIAVPDVETLPKHLINVLRKNLFR